MSAGYYAPPSVGFSRQEYWSGVPLPSPAALFEKTVNYKTLNEKKQEIFHFCMNRIGMSPFR